MLSVGRIARRCGLSRTTLLYYDRIGLLSPSARTAAGYRLYSDRDLARLEAICRYRTAGLALAQIAAIVDGVPSAAAAILAQRFDQLGAEIEALRAQQRVVAHLLAKPGKLRRSRALTKQRWVAILRASGLDDHAMARWHAEFERMAPAAHRDFLVSLGIAPGEVARIRRWARGGAA